MYYSSCVQCLYAQVHAHFCVAFCVTFNTLSSTFQCYMSEMPNDEFVDWRNIWPYHTDRYKAAAVSVQMQMCCTLHRNVSNQITQMQAITLADLDVSEEEFCSRVRHLLCICDYHMFVRKDVESQMYQVTVHFDA